jgi:hypothetical protein
VFSPSSPFYAPASRLWRYCDQLRCLFRNSWGDGVKVNSSGWVGSVPNRNDVESGADDLSYRADPLLVTVIMKHVSPN